MLWSHVLAESYNTLRAVMMMMMVMMMMFEGSVFAGLCTSLLGILGVLNAIPTTDHNPEPSNPTWRLREGPLIELHPKIGWETFSLYAILPAAIFVSYRYVLSEARLRGLGFRVEGF